MHLYLRVLLTAAPLIVNLMACAQTDGLGLAKNTNNCDKLPHCSIANTACQKAILAITACVRGDETPELPPIRTLTREELSDELKAEPSNSVDAGSSGGQQRVSAAVEQVLMALHLVSMQSTLRDAAIADQTSSIAAFYRDEQKDITVIADTTMNTADAMNELAHEFTHYLQDQAGQMKAATAPHARLDELLARRSLIESEAVVNSYRASAQMMGIGVEAVRWSNLFDSIEGNIGTAVNSSDSPFITAWNLLPYTLGGRTIEGIWEDQGRGAVDAMFDDPFVTAIDWFNATGGPLTEPLDCYPPLPPEGFDLVGRDTLGMLGIYALLGAAHRASLQPAKWWSQDELAVYSRHDAAASSSPAALGVWRVRFEYASSAVDFEKSIRGLDLPTKRFGRELVVSVSGSTDEAPIDPDALVDCPSQEQLAASMQDATDSQMHATPRFLRTRLAGPAPRLNGLERL